MAKALIYEDYRYALTGVLIIFARSGRTLSYSELVAEAHLPLNMAGNPVHRNLLSNWLFRLAQEEDAAGRPILPALVVRSGSGQPGPGFFAMLDELGRRREGESETDAHARELADVFAYYGDKRSLIPAWVEPAGDRDRAAIEGTRPPWFALLPLQYPAHRPEFLLVHTEASSPGRAGSYVSPQWLTGSWALLPSISTYRFLLQGDPTVWVLCSWAPDWTGRRVQMALLPESGLIESRKSTVFEAAYEIRDLVNDSRRQQRLMQDRPRWSQVCVCMDVISDTEQAIRGYLAQTTTDHDILYLTTYGVMQAFVIQQDAVVHLAAALGHPIDGWSTRRIKEATHPELVRVRDLRVRAAGHPSRTLVPNEPDGYHLIVQHSLQVGYFELMSWNGARDERSLVDVTKLAKDQQAHIGRWLEQLRDALVEEDRQHKAKFQGERLAELFSGTGYALEKIVEFLAGRGIAAMAHGGLAVLDQALEKLRSALALREVSVDTVDWIYSELTFPLEKIRQILGGGGTEEERKSAYYLAHFVRTQLEMLKAIAAEIDADYTAGAKGRAQEMSGDRT